MNVRVVSRRLVCHDKYLVLLILILTIVSCRAEIEPSAANSASAIIATLGEYVFAMLALILCCIFHIFTQNAKIKGYETVFLFNRVYCNIHNKQLWECNQ